MIDGVAQDERAVVRAVGVADPRVEEAQIVVDLSDRADRGARIVTGRSLFDRDRRAEPGDGVNVRLAKLLEKLAGVRRQALDVPALSFGVDRIESERRLPGTRGAGDHGQRVPRNEGVDVLEVVDPCPAHNDGFVVLRGFPGAT